MTFREKVIEIENLSYDDLKERFDLLKIKTSLTNITEQIMREILIIELMHEYDRTTPLDWYNDVFHPKYYGQDTIDFQVMKS